MADKSDKKNPFELHARHSGPARTHVARQWTPEEQAELLAGYVEIPPEQWSLIRPGTAVRYYTQADEFRYGGVVQLNPVRFTPKDAEGPKLFIRMQSEFGASTTARAWTVAYETLKRVFARPDAVTAVLMTTLEAAVTKLNENIRKVATHSRGLEERIEALEKRLGDRR